jgi:hypothetical protein
MDEFIEALKRIRARTCYMGFKCRTRRELFREMCIKGRLDRRVFKWAWAGALIVKDD